MEKRGPQKEQFAKKSLGQNFLVDANAIKKIVEAVPENTPLLLEIGPGRGALSTELYKRAQKFSLLEKDDLFAEKIEGTLFIHGSRAHRVFHADALDFDWLRLWVDNGLPLTTPLTVAANLPYNVATEILFRLVGLQEKIPLMVLMFQKEVGQRIAAQPGGKEYGAISVAVQLFYDVKIQQILKPGAFRPSPKVDSIVLEFHRRAQPRLALSKDEKDRFLAMVRACFAHRRKTVENSLSMDMAKLWWLKGIAKANLQEILKSVGIDGMRRAETISIEEFGKLFAALGKA
ncbi:MAG: 16S rRNA (adenine(1518)-N(6)/adenine(1519)-N(6))-dimethyltransferase RsmA [Bacteriovoracia bacterium]